MHVIQKIEQASQEQVCLHFANHPFHCCGHVRDVLCLRSWLHQLSDIHKKTMYTHLTSNQQHQEECLFAFCKSFIKYLKYISQDRHSKTIC
jgi:hypothetical protein